MDRIPTMIVAIFGTLLSIISIYTAFFGTLETMIQRCTHLTLISIVSLFAYRYGIRKKHPGIELSINGAIAVVFIISNIWLVLHWRELYISPYLDSTGIFLGTATVIILLEITRRVTGIFLPLVILVSMAYTYFGPYMPGFLSHRGYGMERILVQVYTGTEGIYGIPLGVCASVVILFILFGTFLDQGGASKFLLDLAFSVAGKRVGGSAKVSVLGSGFMGMLSGSAAANVATTGAITIPLMKKSGFPPHVAGAIEPVASSGGYKTPPIMGAVAFVMMELLGVTYFDVCIAAAVPAFFHFLGLYLMVDLYARQNNLRPLPDKEIPTFTQVFRNGYFYLIPIVILTTLIVLQYSPSFAIAYTLLSLWIIGVISKRDRLNWTKVYRALRDGAVRMVIISIPCAGAGIVLGVLSLTGVAMKMSDLITYLSGGSLFLTLVWVMFFCIVLGMGLPPIVSYIMLAALLAPQMITMGVTPMAAHLFIFYYAALSLITPPICVATFTGAAIAESPPMKTGIEAVRFGLVLYTLPFLFAYQPALILDGSILRIMYTLCIAFLGIFSLAIGAQGYFRHSITWKLRLLFVISSLLLFWPHPVPTGMGFALFAGLILREGNLLRSVSRKPKDRPFAASESLERDSRDTRIEF